MAHPQRVAPPARPVMADGNPHKKEQRKEAEDFHLNEGRIPAGRDSQEDHRRKRFERTLPSLAGTKKRLTEFFEQIPCRNQSLFFGIGPGSFQETGSAGTLFVSVVTKRLFFKIVLMILFRQIENPRRNNLRHNPP